LVILYSLKAENRRHERRLDVIQDLLEKKYGYEVREIFRLDDEERNNKFLEGSGAVVFDNPNKRMYVVSSKRCHPDLIQKVKEKLGFDAYYFHCQDEDGIDVYHTDVLMSVGSTWSILCEESFIDSEELEMVKHSLIETNHEIISISLKQMGSFAGNCYEAINDKNEKFIIMSESGYKSLEPEQVETLSKHAKILPMNIHTLETIGGGSVRCMSGDIRLPKKEMIP